MKSYSEIQAMRAVRRDKDSTFFDKGERISDYALDENMESIGTFIESGMSYRNSGYLVYTAYADNSHTQRKLRANFELYYNAEPDVYQYVFEYLHFENGSSALQDILGLTVDDPRTNFNGTYYIVHENGADYLLSESGNVKRAEAWGEEHHLYDFLTSLMIENAVDLNVFDKSDLQNGDEYISPYQYRGGAHYWRSYYAYIPSILEYAGVDLRTFGDKPVFYQYRRQDEETNIIYDCRMYFYYDRNNIPKDNPSVAGFR
jgi:hypothetical protein